MFSASRGVKVRRFSPSTAKCEPMRKICWLITACIVAFSGFASKADEQIWNRHNNSVAEDERNTGAENPLRDIGKEIGLPYKMKKKNWWERMVQGQVGKDRFLILCALKDGNWKKLQEIRDYIEFQIRRNYTPITLRELLVLMAGKPPVHSRRRIQDAGEGWLEKNPRADGVGIHSEWRINQSVYPYLSILLMGCPEDNRCAR